MTDVALLKAKIRHVPDFPKPGILFYDITTLLQDKHGLRAAIDGLAEPFADARRLLERIIGSQYDVFGEKVRVPTREKIAVLARGWLRRLKQ